MRFAHVVSVVAALSGAANAFVLKKATTAAASLHQEDAHHQHHVRGSSSSGGGSSTGETKALSADVAKAAAASSSVWPPPCEHPQYTPTFKWTALKAMVDALNGLDAPYNIHGGTLLGLVRSCNIFDSDVDFVLEHEWLEQNYNRAQLAFHAAGFKLGDTFGYVDEPGYEEAQVHLMQQNNGTALNSAGSFLQARRSLGKRSLIHANGMKVDLFTIERLESSYTWGLWVNGEYHPCSTQSTGTMLYDWLGLEVRVPVPVEAALTSLYGPDFMTARSWTWNVEPFTVGSCEKGEDMTNLLLTKSNSTASSSTWNEVKDTVERISANFAWR